MKSTLAVALFTLIFSTTAFSAEKIVFAVKTHEVLTLKKIAKNRFDKISQVATGALTIDRVTEKGVINLVTQEINEGNDNYLSLEVTGKNSLRVIDAKENINKEIPATVTTSLFGSVKKIQVSSETLRTLYSASMKKSGLDILRKFRLFNGAITSTVNTTDMNCEADGDLLICNQNADLILTIQ